MNHEVTGGAVMKEGVVRSLKAGIYTEYFHNLNVNI